MNYIETYLNEAKEILQRLDREAIFKMVQLLQKVKQSGGRIFFLGAGGGAGHASHAVNDFRKLGGFEAYTPTDNVSELTARINDEGWDTVFVAWLKDSRLRKGDLVFVFSVGGGSLEKNVSPNIVKALQYAKEVGAWVCGVVGRDGGYTAQVADACVIVPPLNPSTITPHTEAFQALVWHLLISHPAIMERSMKWESLNK